MEKAKEMLLHDALKTCIEKEKENIKLKILLTVLAAVFGIVLCKRR